MKKKELTVIHENTLEWRGRTALIEADTARIDPAAPPGYIAVIDDDLKGRLFEFERNRNAEIMYIALKGTDTLSVLVPR